MSKRLWTLEQKMALTTIRKRRWRLANPERAKATDRAYYLSRRQTDEYRHRTKEASRRYRERHKDRLAAETRIRRKRHPEYSIAANYRRRVRLGFARLAGTHTQQEWLEKIELHAGCCFYCGKRKPLSRDHNVPLSRGGTNDITNILPACTNCNSQKRTRTAEEFLGRKQ
jgi:hypothetical protein